MSHPFRPKDKRGVERRPLVPVEKRLALREMVRVRRGHDEDVLVQEVAGERRSRHGDRRLERCAVANTFEPTEQAKLLFVEELHIVDGQELDRRGHFASLRKIRSCLRTTLD